MKKYLLFILSAFILIFTLSSCDTSDLENEYHDFHVAYNDEGHYDLCDCGHKEHEEEHIFSDAIHMIQKESCSQEGIYEYHCIGCDYTKEVRIDKLPHEFGDWETTVEATCLNQGQQKRVCKNCGYEEFKDTNKAPHTPVAYDTVDADCTHEGHTGGTYCEICHEELTPYTILDKTSHHFGEWETTIEPNCEHIGHQHRVCEDCGHEETQELPKTNHIAKSYEDLEADCTHEGHIGGSYCEVCHTELTPSTKVEKASHTYGEWVTTISPACNHEGQAKRVCTECGHEDYKILPITDHTPVPGEALSSTCIAHGHTEGTYCSVCHKELEAPEVLPYSAHNYSIETITKEPTLNDEGILKHTCSVCGDSYNTLIPRLELTQEIWINSLTQAKASNKYIQIYFVDIQNNKTYDITLYNKDGKNEIVIYDYETYKVYEYYHQSINVVESVVDGYRHALYDKTNDPYKKYLDIIINSIFYSSFSYKKVEYNNGYFIAQNIELMNHNGSKEEGTVAIQIDNNYNLEMYAYTSANYVINIQEVGSSPNVIFPKANHHHIVDGKCEVCNELYDSYTTTKNNFILNYYVNKNDKSVEFEYFPLSTNQADVNFAEPLYYEDGKFKRFTSLYYEGTNASIGKTVKGFTVNSNKLLKITYSDNTEERLLLINDNTAIKVTSDSATAANSFNGDIIGQKFDLLTKDGTYRYYIKSSAEIIVTKYKEIDFYVINGKNLIDFESRKLDSVLGSLFMSNNENGVKPDGSTDFIYFTLNEDLSLDINYTYINGLKAFGAIKFLNIEGYYYSDGGDFNIYFMGDNENYKLHYNRNNVEITKLS